MGRVIGTVTLMALLILWGGGCASQGPVAPLVPLPEHMMPKPEDLAYRPWRVVVVEQGTPNRALEQCFSAELRGQLARYGIEQIAADEAVNRVLRQMLNSQVQSGGEVSVSDIQYERSQADGIISVTVTAMTVPKNNAVTSYYDKKKQTTRYTYSSQVDVSGHITLALPGSGNAQVIQWHNTQTQTSYDQPHQFSAHQMAMTGARQAARGSRVMRPLYTQFPLTGYVIGTGERGREIRINRGSNQGVMKDRKWELMMRSEEANALLGRLVTDEVIGTARTLEVFADSCIVKCDSGRTRERAKLGMKVRARDFGFSLGGLFGM